MEEHSNDVVVRVDDGPVRTLRINRPDAENRLNLAVLERLRAQLEDAEKDDACRVVVVTGTGETFCCGGDVAEFAVGDKKAYRVFGERFGGVHLALARLSKPVLAAVNGDARAGGLSLLAICDLAVAGESVRFAMPEIKDGLWPVMAMVSLNRVLCRKRAFELYYFGDSFGVDEALEFGLINWIVADEGFERTVHDRASRLAGLPRSPVRIGKKTFAGIAERDLEAGYDYSAKLLVELLTDPSVAWVLAERRRTE